jgi:mono/diheme cytochrome c family protein
MSGSVRLVVWLIAALPVGLTMAQGDEQLLARGKYLMNSVVACGNCHIARGDQGQPLFEKGLSGGMRFDEAVFDAYAPNITPDAATGIGSWDDAQLAKAIREGIRPDGSVIGPPMPIPFYRHLSDNDLAAIIAYLKAQPAVANKVNQSTYRMPLPPNYGPPVKDVKAPPSTDRIAYGEYLSNIGHCMDCHTPRDAKGQLVMSKLGAGGQAFKGPWGMSLSRNLTPDETGLKDWTDKQIAVAIRDGVDRNGVHYKPPMAFGWYKNINSDDMQALIAYLRSLPPQKLGQ